MDDIRYGKGLPLVGILLPPPYSKQLHIRLRTIHPEHLFSLVIIEGFLHLCQLYEACMVYGVEVFAHLDLGYPRTS